LPDAPESKIPPERQEPLRKCVILVDKTSADPETWLTINDPNCPGAKVTLYQASKKNILDKKGLLTDSEIHAGQVLLKHEDKNKQFNTVRCCKVQKGKQEQ
jgi:hypothetical protein